MRYLGCLLLLVSQSGALAFADEPIRDLAENPNLSLPLNVRVINFPDPQNVAGTVDVGNLPDIQTVDGAVTVGNLPTAEDGSLLVSCPSAQAPYQFFGDIFGSPVALSASSLELVIGSFDVEGPANATVFLQLSPQVENAQAYDAVVVLAGYFDGPPSIKVFEADVARYRHYPHYFCSGQGHPAINQMSVIESTAFNNRIGLPNVRFTLRVEYLPNNLCTDPTYPDYQGPPPEEIDVTVDTLSVFIR